MVQFPVWPLLKPLSMSTGLSPCCIQGGLNAAPPAGPRSEVTLRGPNGGSGHFGLTWDQLFQAFLLVLTSVTAPRTHLKLGTQRRTRRCRTEAGQCHHIWLPWLVPLASTSQETGVSQCGSGLLCCSSSVLCPSTQYVCPHSPGPVASLLSHM